MAGEVGKLKAQVESLERERSKWLAELQAENM
jgi:hypothetical protein